MDKKQKVQLARELRLNQTDAEQKPWTVLRSRQFHGLKFRRQHPVRNYVADFICLEKNLVIEVDGGQHNDELTMKKDKQRRKWLEAEGFQVLRFWNNDVLENIEGVIFKVQEFLGKGGTLI